MRADANSCRHKQWILAGRKQVDPDQDNGAVEPLRRVGMQFGFRKADRLLKRSEFRRLSRSGRQVINRFFVIRYHRRSSIELPAMPRMGVTVSRRVGNAVVRNRTKRVVRETYRHHRDLLPEAVDLNIIARSGAAGQPYHLLSAALQTLFKKMKARENA